MPSATSAAYRPDSASSVPSVACTADWQTAASFGPFAAYRPDSASFGSFAACREQKSTHPCSQTESRKKYLPPRECLA